MASEMRINTEGNARSKPVITPRDIVFNCPSCQGELVVDREGAGLECLCAHCGFPLVIPDLASPQPFKSELPPLASLVPPVPPVSPVAPAPEAKTPSPRRFDFGEIEPGQVTRRVDELKHQLKENMSQHTETRGHVNRATIELHRLQLRLKTLQDRQTDIEAELSAAKDWLDSEGA